MDLLNHKVAQHNSLINSQFIMGINEVRLFLFLLAKINREDTDFRLEEVPVSVFKNEKGNIHYQDIRDASDKIVGRKIAIENEDGFDYIPLMARCTYKKGEGFIKAMFNKEVKPYLLQLKGNFTISQLSELIKLKSYNSHRIYWLLKQYNKFGERLIPLEKLKTILGLDGKYKKSKDFRRRILDKAQEELINTDMAFFFEEIRKGQKVTHIQFKFNNTCNIKRTSTIVQDIDINYSEREERLIERLKELSLDEKQIKVIIESIGAGPESGVWKLINDIKMNIRDGRVQTNQGGYVAKMFDNKYNLGFFSSKI